MESCKIETTEEDKLFFITVTTFNINARYDDYKMSFYKMCTPEFTGIWLKKIKEKTVMDKGTDKQVREFLAEVELEYSNLTGAYLFGSFARGTQRKDSDIDIALIFDGINDERKFELQVQLMLLASQYDLRIEPHPLSMEEFDSYNPFIAEVKSGGIDLLAKMQHSK